MDRNKKSSGIHYAWLILFGLCIIVGIARGTLNNSGSLFLSVVSEDLNVGMGTLSLYFSIASIVTMIFLPIAGKLMAKYNIALVLMIAAISQGGAFTLFGFGKSVYTWYLLAIPLAFGSIFVGQMAGPVLINSWFKKKNGLAIGLMMAASGTLGAIIMPIVGKLILNYGWRSAYKIIGVLALSISVLTIALLIRKPEDKNMSPYGSEDNHSETTNLNTVVGVTLKDARKTSSFYALIIFFFLITSFGSFAMHIPTYASFLGHDVTFSSSLMSANLVGQVIGSLAFGYLSDKIGAKTTALLALSSGLICILSLIFFASNQTILIIAVVLFGFVTASIGTLGPVLTTSLFGPKEYSEIFSNASLGLAVAGIVTLPVYGYIFQFTNSYSGALYLILFMLLAAIVSVLVAYAGKEKMIKDNLFS